jgi:hypothetical protein
MDRRTRLAVTLPFLAFGLLLSWPLHAAELLLGTGASLLHGDIGPVGSLDLTFPTAHAFDIVLGATVWGHTSAADTNSDVHIALRGCRGRLCATLGAIYLSHTDGLDGARANFLLGLSWRIGEGRAESVAYVHASDAAIRYPNYGRNAVIMQWRLAP